LSLKGNWALPCVVLCLLCPFALAQSADLPIETKLDTLAESALSTSAAESTSPPEVPENIPAQTEDGQLLWPMMPHETLAQLAKTFYPDSPILEQRFIQKTIRLTKALGVALLPDTPFKRVQVIAIPDEKEVRAMTHRIKKMEEITHAQNQLKLSYQLKLSDQLKKIIPPAPKPSKTIPHHPQAQAKPVLIKPTLPAPETSSQWAHMWQQTQSTVSSWVVTAKTYWMAETPSWMQQLHHPQWRSGLYLTLLLLMGLGLWRLQKRYMRRQIALLNTIATTLEDADSDALSETAAAELQNAAVSILTPYHQHTHEEDRSAAA
jgi:hypothetical protein